MNLLRFSPCEAAVGIIEDPKAIFTNNNNNNNNNNNKIIVIKLAIKENSS